MKKITTASAIIITIIMVLTLTACGGNGDNYTTQDAPSNDNGATTQEAINESVEETPQSDEATEGESNYMIGVLSEDFREGLYISGTFFELGTQLGTLHDDFAEAHPDLSVITTRRGRVDITHPDIRGEISIRTDGSPDNPDESTWTITLIVAIGIHEFYELGVTVKTADGIGTGSTQDEVISMYGQTFDGAAGSNSSREVYLFARYEDYAEDGRIYNFNIMFGLAHTGISAMTMYLEPNQFG